MSAFWPSKLCTRTGLPRVISFLITSASFMTDTDAPLSTNVSTSSPLTLAGYKRRSRAVRKSVRFCRQVGLGTLFYSFFSFHCSWMRRSDRLWVILASDIRLTARFHPCSSMEHFRDDILDDANSVQSNLWRCFWNSLVVVTPQFWAISLAPVSVVP